MHSFANTPRAFCRGLDLLVRCVGLLLLATRTLAGITPEEVVIVYSSKNPDSRAVAEHYAQRRHIPESHRIGLTVSSDSVLSRAEYEEQIEKPLIAELARRGLATFSPAAPPPNERIVEKPSNRCTAASVRCLVLCYGMPYRIQNDPSRIIGAATNIPIEIRRNSASVDSELHLLPSAGNYTLSAGIPNPAYGNTNRNNSHPTNGLFLVGRLDGPSPAIARGLVDKAIACETNGFAGNAYMDLRNIQSGPYKTGDAWITNAATTALRTGFNTVIDNLPPTLPPTFPLAQVGLYVGWYTEHVDGPFKRPEVEFLPGAIAYHLHSFSAAKPRSPSEHWVGPLLERGATVTFGSVEEPYLDLTPNPHILLEFLIAGGFTLGEASLASQPWLSWANAYFGDPLFTPFDTDLTALETRQSNQHNPNQVWTVLRKANMILAAGQNRSNVRETLARFELTTNSPVLMEKVAELYAADFQYRPASEWARRALTAKPTPQHALRIRLALAEWLALSQQRDAAFDLLAEVERDRPDYRDFLPFRERQLQLARDTVRHAEMSRLQDEIVRLKSATLPPNRKR